MLTRLSHHLPMRRDISLLGGLCLSSLLALGCSITSRFDTMRCFTRVNETLVDVAFKLAELVVRELVNIKFKDLVVAT